MNQVIQLLEEEQVDYEIIHHEIVIQTAQQGAAYFGIEAGQTAPTLIIRAGTEFYALILSGDYGKVDFSKIQEILGCEEGVVLAKPKEVESQTGYSVGSVPLVGHGLRTIIDRQLNRYRYIYGGSGQANSTLKIAPGDVEQINRIQAYLR